MASYPSRLISTEEKVEIVINKTCEECIFIYRALEDVPLYTIRDVIDPYVIDFKRFCGLSINTLFCQNKNLRFLTTVDDVKFRIEGDNRKELTFKTFESNAQIPDLKDIKFSYTGSHNVIGFRKKDIEKISDKYPFSKRKKPELFDFKLGIEYKPTPVNVFHFEICIEGNHESKGKEFKKFKGTTDKKYLESIIGRIRNRIIRTNFLFEIDDYFQY